MIASNVSSPQHFISLDFVLENSLLLFINQTTGERCYKKKQVVETTRYKSKITVLELYY